MAKKQQKSQQQLAIERHLHATMEPEGKKHNFALISEYAVTHKSFIALSDKAKVAWVYMRIAVPHFPNYWETGKFEFAASILVNLGYMKLYTAQKVLNELCESGFIRKEYKHNEYSIDRYSFSMKWYSGRDDREIEIDNYVTVKSRSMVW